MTFQALWGSFKKTWQSRPFAIILPLAALVWFWYKHGHVWALATVGNGGSLPTWPDLVAGMTLLATKSERFTELIFGAPSAASLPAPVASPLLAKGPGDPPKGA